MSDTTMLAPTAGWYPDPTTAAAYRWWNGSEWTTDVLDEQSATSMQSAAPEISVTEDLPSRRSIREALDSPAPRRPGVSQAETQSVPGSTRGDWSIPESWAANSPTSPVEGHAVYSSGVPFRTTNATAASTPVYGASSARTPAFGETEMGRKTRPTRSATREARFGLFAAIVAVAGLGYLAADLALAHRVITVWPFGAFVAVAGLVFSIAGVRKALELQAGGWLPVGFRRAVVGVVLASLALLGQGVETTLALSVPHPTSLTQTAAAGAGEQAAPSIPVVGVPQGGAIVYSQAQAQTSIGAAYTAVLKVRPAHVACPTAETIAVSESFQCTVTLPGGLKTDASVTIVDAQGHAEVQVS